MATERGGGRDCAKGKGDARWNQNEEQAAEASELAMAGSGGQVTESGIT